MTANGIKVEPVSVIKEELEGDKLVTAEDDVFQDHAAIKKEQVSIEELLPAVNKETAVKEEPDDLQDQGDEIVVKEELRGVLHNLVGKREFREENGESTFRDRCSTENYRHIENQFSSSSSFISCNQSGVDESQLSVTGTFPNKFSQATNLKHDLMICNNEKSFECNVCSNSIQDRGYLRLHLMTHSNERPFVCKECPKAFKKPIELKKHLKIHRDKKAFGCDVCSKTFRSKHYLKLHLMLHSNGKTFRCDVCSKPFLDSLMLQRHTITHHNGKSFVCNKCSKAFCSEASLRAHMLIHGRKKCFRCIVCLKYFRATSLIRKFLQAHNIVNSFVCKVCAKALPTKS